MNERESWTTEKAEVGSAFKKKWVTAPPPTQKCYLSIVTARENMNPDFESKSGGKTRFWDKEHREHVAPHGALGGTYPKISEAVGLFREAHLVKQTEDTEPPLGSEVPCQGEILLDTTKTESTNVRKVLDFAKDAESAGTYKKCVQSWSLEVCFPFTKAVDVNLLINSH